MYCLVKTIVHFRGDRWLPGGAIKKDIERDVEKNLDVTLSQSHKKEIGIDLEVHAEGLVPQRLDAASLEALISTVLVVD
jgi:hypothetical protein